MKNLFEKAVDIVLYLSFVALFKILSKISTVLTIILGFNIILEGLSLNMT